MPIAFLGNPMLEINVFCVGGEKNMKQFVLTSQEKKSYKM
jgi:hypothetical protein